MVIRSCLVAHTLKNCSSLSSKILIPCLPLFIACFVAISFCIYGPVTKITFDRVEFCTTIISLWSDSSIQITNRIDVSIFIPQRLKAKKKTTKLLVRDFLLYGIDCGMVVSQ